MFGLNDCARLGSLYARRLAGVAALLVVSSGAAAVVVIPNLFPFLDPTGLVLGGTPSSNARISLLAKSCLIRAR